MTDLYANGKKVSMVSKNGVNFYRNGFENIGKKVVFNSSDPFFYFAYRNLAGGTDNLRFAGVYETITNQNTVHDGECWKVAGVTCLPKNKIFVSKYDRQFVNAGYTVEKKVESNGQIFHLLNDLRCYYLSYITDDNSSIRFWDFALICPIDELESIATLADK